MNKYKIIYEYVQCERYVLYLHSHRYRYII